MRTHRNQTIPLCCIALALGLGTAQGSALWDINKDKTAVVQAVHYEENYLFGQLAYPNGGGDVYFIRATDTNWWNFRQPGHEFADQCEGDLTANVEDYNFQAFQWNSNGVGTVSGNIWEGFDVCGQTNIGYTANLTRTGPNPGYFSTGGRVRVYDDGATLKNESLNRTGRTTCELWTGGRAVPGRKSFFLIAAWAQGIGNYFYPEEDLYPEYYNVSPDAIQLGDTGRQSSRGYLIKAFGNGEPHDVTPTVAGLPYYQYRVQGHAAIFVQFAVPFAGPGGPDADQPGRWRGSGLEFQSRSAGSP